MRAARQFGNKLTKDTGHVNSGIGPELMLEEPTPLRVPVPTHVFEHELIFSLVGMYASAKCFLLQ